MLNKTHLYALYAVLLFMFSGSWMHAVLTDERASRTVAEARARTGGAFSLLCAAPHDSRLAPVLNQSSAYPGDCIGLYIAHAKGPGQFTVSAPFYEKPLTFYPYGDGYTALVPIYAWLKPGDYQIRVTDSRANTETIVTVRILPKTFDIQYLWVVESTAAILNDENSAKDQAYFDAARANPIQEKLWDGPFVQPAQGTITTTYNSMRYTNGNPVPTRHLAIDIGNAEGTPVIAANNGKVVLARKLIVPGNTVVIDHGMGIFTSSVHLSEISVEEGTRVKKGDVIGKMGSTGYAAGAHLHFAVWKEGTFINPNFLFATDPVSFSQ
jgi:murein DD-endopeptidase MepM/ murein hydrolase activator NlpD